MKGEESMKDNSKAVASMLLKDTVLLAVFLLAALGISCFVLLQVLPIVESAGVRTVLIAVSAVTMAVLAGSMAWVTMHLRKNADDVYGEDLYYQELIRRQRGGLQA